MQRKSLLFVFLLISIYGRSFSFDTANVSAQLYIQEHKDQAVREMKYNFIPASITLAQGMVETACGSSELAKNANNHFGIKCHETWNGETYTYSDDAANECFRKYGTSADSYADHSTFLRTRPRYAFLFNLRITDYRSWAKGLKAAGYATNPKYAEMLIRVIEKYDLSRFDFVIEEPAEEKAELKAIELTVITCTADEEQQSSDFIVPVIEQEECTEPSPEYFYLPSAAMSENEFIFDDEFNSAERY